MASVAIGLLLLELSRQSSDAQVGRGEAIVARACDLIRGRYDFYASGWTGPVPPLTDARLRADLATAVGLALTRQDGVEGGVWQADAGPLAYAFPTYEGSGPKTDLPVAERDQIEALNQQAARDEQPASRRLTTRGQTLLLHACPLSGPISGLTAWTMTRIRVAAGFGPLRLGLGVLFGLVMAMSAWLGRTLITWGRHVRGIEAALGGTSHGDMPPLRQTGERELDRIIDALNEAGRRVAEARRESEAMAARAARAERMAGLGRVAAGVAHEIRNPIAAARLQGENALAGDDARRREAIGAMLGQIERLDGLVSELLAMTQRVDPSPVEIELSRFLHERTDRHEVAAAARAVTVEVDALAGRAFLDPAVAGRVLDNLLSNAIRHAPEGGKVIVAAERGARGLSITVEDTGEGVPPEMTERLFEPFVTGRADGTGLGLAIARELADAHGGRVVLRRAGGGAGGQGAVFALELPQEDWCRRS